MFQIKYITNNKKSSEKLISKLYSLQSYFLTFLGGPVVFIFYGASTA